MSLIDLLSPLLYLMLSESEMPLKKGGGVWPEHNGSALSIRLGRK